MAIQRSTSTTSSKEIKKAEGFINLQIKAGNGEIYDVPVIVACHLDKDKDGVLEAILAKHGETLEFTGKIVDARVGSGKEKFKF